MFKSLTGKATITIATLLLLGFAAHCHAGGCIEGGCHEDKTDYKYLHGPLAAEEAMGNGCVKCHLPNGRDCTEDEGGRYKFTKPKEDMCTSCHDKSESPDHVGREHNCLRCHSPHGSDKSIYLLRARQP